MSLCLAADGVACKQWGGILLPPKGVMAAAEKSVLVGFVVFTVACSRAPDVVPSGSSPPTRGSASGDFDAFDGSSKLVVRVGSDMILHVKTADGKVVGDAAADDGGEYFRQLRQRRGDVPVALAVDSDLPQSTADSLFDELREAGFTRLERPVTP